MFNFIVQLKVTSLIFAQMNNQLQWWFILSLSRQEQQLQRDVITAKTRQKSYFYISIFLVLHFVLMIIVKLPALKHFLNTNIKRS